ncbi:hypothetical protein NQ315_003784, partial [Exocentrus adspersus]
TTDYINENRRLLKHGVVRQVPPGIVLPLDMTDGTDATNTPTKSPTDTLVSVNENVTSLEVVGDVPTASSSITLATLDLPSTSKQTDIHISSTSCHTSVDHTCSDTINILFLWNKERVFLVRQDFQRKNLTPEESIMYKVHQNVTSKLSKLKTMLKDERAQLKSLRNLYEDGRFCFIEENLNDVTKEFINSQLRNVNQKPNARRWTLQDKAFALSTNH